MHIVARDGVAGIKRRHRDVSSDGVRNLAMTSGRGRLGKDLESSTWARIVVKGGGDLWEYTASKGGDGGAFVCLVAKGGDGGACKVVGWLLVTWW
ncbi:hypothetical protein Tco_1316767 [Tanacetum coccineum]